MVKSCSMRVSVNVLCGCGMIDVEKYIVLNDALVCGCMVVVRLMNDVCGVCVCVCGSVRSRIRCDSARAVLVPLPIL